MKKILLLLLCGFMTILLTSGITFAVPQISSMNGVFNTSTSEWAGHYADGDGIVGPGVGGQNYDVEYLGLYLGSESGVDYVYFGLQTGFDLVDKTEEIHGYTAGDIALSTTSGVYDYGIKWAVSGANVNYELWQVSTWNAPSVVAHQSASDPWSIASGTVLTSWTQNGAFSSMAGSIVGPNDGGPGQTSYVIEGAFELAGSDANHSSSWNLAGLELIHWTMQCGNDHLEFTPNSVPEPANMILLGTGLLSLVGIGRKRLFKK